MIAVVILLAVWAATATGFVIWLAWQLRRDQAPGAHRPITRLADGTRLTAIPTRQEIPR